MAGDAMRSLLALSTARASARVRHINMAGRYGMTFAKKHIEEGNYEEAIASATEEIDGGATSPDHLFDRGTAYELVERYVDAVADFEKAIAQNKIEKELDPFVLDDAYFSATLAAARSEATANLRSALSRLDKYREVLPDGAHIAESRDWQKRLRGEMPSLLDKTKDIEVA
jgi:tetratricopeptide (TPR) repeat protein